MIIILKTLSAHSPVKHKASVDGGWTALCHAFELFVEDPFLLQVCIFLTQCPLTCNKNLLCFC